MVDIPSVAWIDGALGKSVVASVESLGFTTSYGANTKGIVDAPSPTRYPTSGFLTFAAHSAYHHLPGLDPHPPTLVYLGLLCVPRVTIRQLSSTDLAWRE